MSFESREVFGYAGVCRLQLEVERPIAGLEERLTGALVLDAGVWPEPIRQAEVALADDTALVVGRAVVLEAVRWTDFRLQPKERLRLPFALKVPWGQALEQTAQLCAVMQPLHTVPSAIGLPIRVRPPSALLGLADTLASAAGLRVTGWRTFRAGDAVRLFASLKEAPRSAGVFQQGRLEMQRAGARLEGNLVLHPWVAGLLRRSRPASFQFTEDWPIPGTDGVIDRFGQWLQAYLAGHDALPVPSRSSEARPPGLPVPAVSGPVQAGELPVVVPQPD